MGSEMCIRDSEKDRQRAVRAGLDIVQGVRSYQDGVKSRWNLDFGARVGINTGLVVVNLDEAGNVQAVDTGDLRRYYRPLTVSIFHMRPVQPSQSELNAAGLDRYQIHIGKYS